VPVVAARIPVDGGAFTLEAEARIAGGAAGAIVCHPHPAFGGRMDTPLVRALDDALTAAGLSTVRFNFRGVGASGGEPTGGRREHEDVRAAAAWLRQRGALRIVLVGYSFGALMATRAVGDGEAVAGCACVAFPTTILEETGDRAEHVARALDRGLPWLFVGGDADGFCELDRIRGWAHGRPSVRVDVLPDVDHFFAGAATRDACARVAAFALRTTDGRGWAD
jgi:uncharacterized protein